MPTLEAAIAVYLKLNLMFVLAWVLWKVCNASESLYRTSLSSQSRLRLGRTILLSAMLLPIIAITFSMLTPLQLPFARSGFEIGSVLPEGDTGYWFLILFVSTLLIGFFYKIATLVEELIQLSKVIRSSTRLKKIGNAELLYSASIAVPFATGVVKSLYIVIPEDLLLSRKSLSIVLDHESQHVRSGDLYWLFFLRIIAIFCFWNPAVLAWQKTLHALQEYACDEAVTAKAQVSKQAYAECLYAVASRATCRRYSLVLPMGVWSRSTAEAGSELRQRIVAIYNSRSTESSSKKYAVAPALVMLLGSMLLFGETEFGTHSTTQLEQGPFSGSTFEPDPFFGMFR